MTVVIYYMWHSLYDVQVADGIVVAGRVCGRHYRFSACVDCGPTDLAVMMVPHSHRSHSRQSGHSLTDGLLVTTTCGSENKYYVIGGRNVHCTGRPIRIM